jgi:hypothetical protein
MEPRYTHVNVNAQCCITPKLVDCCSAFHFHDAGKLVTQQLQPSARPLAIAPTLLKVFGFF